MFDALAELLLVGSGLVIGSCRLERLICCYIDLAFPFRLLFLPLLRLLFLLLLFLLSNRLLEDVKDISDLKVRFFEDVKKFVLVVGDEVVLICGRESDRVSKQIEYFIVYAYVMK